MSLLITDPSVFTLAQASSTTPAAPAVNAVGVPGAPTPTAGAGTAAVPGSATPVGGGAVGGGVGPGGGSPGGLFGGMGILLPMILVLGFVFITTTMAGRKDKKKRADLLAGLSRNDKIQTTGGVIGTITDIQDNDVVIRLEEGRMRIAKSAIAGVLTSAKQPKSQVEAKEAAKAAV